MTQLKDFSNTIYEKLLQTIVREGYRTVTVEEYIRNKPCNEKIVMLRHDIDARPKHAVVFARLQHKYGLRGSYYWRVVPQSFDEDAIREVVDLGHELGYHYEDLTLCKGNVEQAIRHFSEKLTMFRRYYPVSTICMHGSPATKWDNKDVWRSHSYRDYDILGEPYFDINFQEVAYLTDTGRMWDGHRFSVRDKVDSRFEFNIHSTADLIRSFQQGVLPEQVMLTFHPQRWTSDTLLWGRELVVQSVKNQVKAFLIKRNAGR